LILGLIRKASLERLSKSNLLVFDVGIYLLLGWLEPEGKTVDGEKITFV
jgi:hypothetical protein